MNSNSGSAGATTWIHVDVIEFKGSFQDDKYFIKTKNELLGGKIIDLVIKQGFEISCNCKNTDINSDPNGLSKKNYSIEDAKKGLKIIYEEYGKEMAIIIEKMYRTETSHFKSIQFKKTGTGGMESHGVGPYFGWSKDFFVSYPEYSPLGVFAIKENKGAGGNKQDKKNKKRFVIMPSVYAGMKYKANYIKNYDMDYARWYSTDEANKKIYRESLKGVKARIVEKF